MAILQHLFAVALASFKDYVRLAYFITLQLHSSAIFGTFDA